MGIDYDGGMIVGAKGDVILSKNEFEEGIFEWAEEHELDDMSLWYDADPEDKYYGFRVKDVLVSEIEGEWLADVKEKARKFQALTGIPAELIGTQNIW